MINGVPHGLETSISNHTYIICTQQKYMHMYMLGGLQEHTINSFIRK